MCIHHSTIASESKRNSSAVQGIYPKKHSKKHKKINPKSQKGKDQNQTTFFLNMLEFSCLKISPYFPLNREDAGLLKRGVRFLMGFTPAKTRIRNDKNKNFSLLMVDSQTVLLFGNNNIKKFQN